MLEKELLLLLQSLRVICTCFACISFHCGIRVAVGITHLKGSAVLAGQDAVQVGHVGLVVAGVMHLHSIAKTCTRACGLFMSDTSSSRRPRFVSVHRSVTNIHTVIVFSSKCGSRASYSYLSGGSVKVDADRDETQLNARKAARPRLASSAISRSKC